MTMPHEGDLLRLEPGLKWHNAYIVDGSDNIIEETHFSYKNLKNGTRLNNVQLALS